MDKPMFLQTPGFVDTQKKYLYLCLRKTDRVKDFLKHFPHYDSEFTTYKNEVNSFILELHKAYLWQYVLKSETKIIDTRWKPHIERLHREYLRERKPVKLSIIKKYLKEMEPRELFFHLHSA
jgi:hypothetical protein